ncbi:MAG: helix-turn-helix domain-containing protein [Methanomicrobiales archaeon]
MARIEPMDRLLRAALNSNEEFVTTLQEILREDLRISVRELCERSGVAPSTMYKIMQGARSPNLTTLRAILRAVSGMQRWGSDPFIALIAARYVLEGVEGNYMEIEGRTVLVREYPAHSVEEAYIAALRAERDGASAIVCAPIISSTVEQMVRIPVTTIMPRESIPRAIGVAVRKAWH